MKRWWRKWTYERPLAFSDALWDICVVQFAAFLDRLTLRKAIEYVLILMLAIAFAQSLPIEFTLCFYECIRNAGKMPAAGKRS